MPYSILYILIIVVAIIGGVGTFMVGYSKANKQANSEYTQKTTGNLKKLSLFYIIVTIISIVSFIMYLFMRD
jgi:heme/copper-type cytochrome/quinol oxidase subunit 2